MIGEHNMRIRVNGDPVPKKEIFFEKQISFFEKKVLQNYEGERTGKEHFQKIMFLENLYSNVII